MDNPYLLLLSRVSGRKLLCFVFPFYFPYFPFISVFISVFIFLLFSFLFSFLFSPAMLTWSTKKGLSHQCNANEAVRKHRRNNTDFSTPPCLTTNSDVMSVVVHNSVQYAVKKNENKKSAGSNSGPPALQIFPYGKHNGNSRGFVFVFCCCC